jgi:hypothetical protein
MRAMRNKFGQILFFLSFAEKIKIKRERKTEDRMI